MKLSVIGGESTLGAIAGYFAGEKDVFEEVCLINLNEIISKNNRIDIKQGITKYSNVRIMSGGFEKLEGSKIIVVAGETLYEKGLTELHNLEENLRLINKISEYITTYANNPIVITAISPIDICNVFMKKMTSINSNKLLGYSYNDTYRFKWAISKVLNVNFNAIEAYVIGEHGETQCPIYSNVKINGDKYLLNTMEKKEISNIINNWWGDYDGLNLRRTLDWPAEVNLASIVSAIANEKDEVIPFSILDEDGISIGRPVVVGKNGVKRIIDLELTEEEQRNFNLSKISILEQLIYAKQLAVTQKY